MAISLSDCRAVAEECRKILVGGLIQKIHQPQPFLLTLDIRKPGESWSLLISVEPGFARLHITAHKPKNPPTPFQFCQYLRAHLEGGRIESITQEPEDRIVYITVMKSSNLYQIVVALTGNQSNVLVLDQERRILRSLKPSRLEIGDPYVPPVLQKREPEHSSSPSLQKEGRKISKANVGRPQPSQSRANKGETVTNRIPVSVELEERFRKQMDLQHRLEWFKVRTAEVRKSLKQATRRRHTLEADLAKAEKYQEYQRYGELLKSQLHTIQPRQAVIDVVDYYDPALPTLSLPLNVLKDPVWNLEDYFRKYRKYISAQEHLRPRLERTENEIQSLQEELEKLKNKELDDLIDSPTGNSEVPNGPASLSRPSLSKGETQLGTYQTHMNRPLYHDDRTSNGKKEKSHQTSKQYRTFESYDGLTILVGKSAADNDFLTMKVAKPDDVWLHARGTPGSHVVVRIDKSTEIPHETLRDAATLALFYSNLKKSGKGEVIHTLRKFVKKTKGLKAGAVHVTREKSIWIELNKDRLDRLKGGL
ncbi:MAG: hypothetical protein NPIRA05_06260 [Nitrospirales bacterium]|nr:MAG: hypothetical protein NPIRA05_06260 [Nitrospirales bacterium]